MNDAREFFVFESARQLFGVPTEEVAGTAEMATPACLPLAPPAILGVVCLRGRMLTVIDPTALAKAPPSQSRAVLPLVVVMRGDEQLALAADRRLESLRVEAREIRSAPAEEISTSTGALPPSESAVVGSVPRGNQRVVILDPRKLFAAAMGKYERRRRRT